nr:uncharacterized protein LOC108074384 [Drosophila kikkawai]
MLSPRPLDPRCPISGILLNPGSPRCLGCLIMSQIFTPVARSVMARKESSPSKQKSNEASRGNQGQIRTAAGMKVDSVIMAGINLRRTDRQPVEGGKGYNRDGIDRPDPGLATQKSEGGEQQ